MKKIFSTLGIIWSTTMTILAIEGWYLWGAHIYNDWVAKGRPDYYPEERNE